MEKIDKMDLKILSELQEDARKSLREIAEKLGVTEATIYNRINKLKKLGVIERFIPVINYSKLGYDLIAVIGITAKGGKVVEVEKLLAEMPNVTAVYDVTGEFDVIAVSKFRDRDSLNEFVKNIGKLEFVEKTYTMLVLNVVKETHMIDLSELIE
ncbi:Transcriptional regulator [Geoglobus ahangari]|uniref:Transcriptional regulator n=1 Tax=Geoglobus ahangari TaxID=113653 RepID=A0A0F7IE61_9EURY|nr:Lrp/AsnC family transcriptional regulator [Geoglobus ahangari]AKG91789.1 Transcriptional regulator [Geoglobus ahangari]NOY11233.1 Lrp/AsnC family transcriptional regulator [Archaeoglobi archaeon]